MMLSTERKFYFRRAAAYYENAACLVVGKCMACM
jgi:hypothetical protein